MTDFPRPIARERIAAFPRDRGSEDILDVSKHYQKGAGQRCLQKANGLRQTGERVQWPGQGDLGWNLRTDVFSMILVAITIALDDEEKKRAKKAKVEARLDAGLPARNRKRGGNRRDEYFSPELPHDTRL